jgi:hypothetical protein
MAAPRTVTRTERANFLLTPDERRALEALAARHSTTMTSVVVDLVRQAARAEDVFPTPEQDTTGQAAGAVGATA